MLVINYTELDFPVDGIKFNEGHVIGECLRRSSVDQLVISTGSESRRFLTIEDENDIDQGRISDFYFKGKIIHPRNKEKQGVFDFQTNRFQTSFLEATLDEYEMIVFNFHSLNPENSDIVKHLAKLPSDKVKLVYTAHDTNVKREVGYEEFLSKMDSVISFVGKSESQDILRERFHQVKLGVDEEAYKPSQNDDECHLIIASHITHSYARYYPFHIMVCNEVLGIRHDVMVLLDFTNRNRRFVSNLHEIDVWRDERRLVEENHMYGLTRDCRVNSLPNVYSCENPLEGANLFFSPYKTEGIDVNVLKALMSGIPIILPENDNHSNVLNRQNSISFQDDIATYGYRIRAVNNIQASVESCKRILSFEREHFDRDAIREEVIEKGYTARRMVAELDYIFNSL